MIAVAQKIYSLTYNGKRERISASALATLNDSMAVRYKTADAATKRKIVATFLNLNWVYLKRPPFIFQNQMDAEDWFSEFKLMLPRAFENYDPTRGHLHTYIIGWKHASLNAWIRDHGVIRLPDNQRLRFNKISKKLRTGREGEISAEDKAFYDMASFHMVSMNSRKSMDGEELQEIMVGEDPRDTAGESTDKTLWAKVKEMLTPDEYQIWMWAHHPDFELTHQEIADRKGYTHQRASEKLKEIRGKLRVRMAAYLKRIENEA